MPRKVIIRQFGGSENLEIAEFSVEPPSSGEVTVEHKAVGLNYIDIYQRTGLYPLELPTALGVEASGVVTQVGDGVAHLKVGDRVAYASGKPGAYADVRNLAAAQVCKLPDEISFKIGAAVMLTGLTVQYLFHRTTHLNRGDTVLFHAAAGGVGLIACQWARSEGINLIATAGSDEKCQLALQNGAKHCINYRSHDFVKEVKEITNGEGVEAVMDSVGASTFLGSLDCLKPMGMCAAYGHVSGPPDPLDVIQDLGRRGSLFITRPAIMHYLATRDDLEWAANDLFKAISKGTIKSKVNYEFQLKDAVKAHEGIESGKTAGSILLLP